MGLQSLKKGLGNTLKNCFYQVNSGNLLQKNYK